MNLRTIVLCCAAFFLAGTFVSGETIEVQPEKNDIGVIAGVTATPSRSLTPGSVFPGDDPNLTSKASLALGVDYDRRVVSTDWVTIYGGGDFLASPFSGFPV